MIKDDRGFVTVITAITLPVMLLFAAFALDFGRAFILKHELQSAADAAALAGASQAALRSEYETWEVQAGIVEEWAGWLAEYVFNKNAADNRLQERGVENITVLYSHATNNSSDYTDPGDHPKTMYYFSIQADIESVFARPLLTGSSKLTVNVEAVSQVRER